MKRSINILVVLSLLIATASCSKWLDVGPSNQTGEGDLFKEGQGYEVALNGIYQILAKPEVYGGNLSWGMVSAMGQEYAAGDSVALPSGLDDASKHMYNTILTEKMVDDIWTNMYNAIANCNNLIQNIEGADPEIFEFKDLEKDMIKGEALALRAMIHFDLLRLFAPAPVAAESGKTYIPYNKVHPTYVGTPLTVKDYLSNVISDFKAGMELTARMDTLPEYNSFARSGIENRLQGYGVSEQFLKYRSTRLNYYTITTLLARAQLYAGDNAGALESASILDSLIDNDSGFSSTFKFTPSYNLSYSDVNRRYIKSPYDIILAFFNNDQIEETRDFYDEDGVYGHLIVRDAQGLFNGELQDHRYRYMMIPMAKYNGYTPLMWYPSTDYQIARSNHPLIPVMRLSEVYLIIAETIFDSDPETGLLYLNVVRSSRGVYADYEMSDIDGKKENFQKLIYKEMLKEYISQGQSFYTAKRLNLQGSDMVLPKGGTLNYVLPIPASNNVF